MRLFKIFICRNGTLLSVERDVLNALLRGPDVSPSVRLSATNKSPRTHAAGPATKLGDKLRSPQGLLETFLFPVMYEQKRHFHDRFCFFHFCFLFCFVSF